jgi:cytochrome c5
VVILKKIYTYCAAAGLLLGMLPAAWAVVDRDVDFHVTSEEVLLELIYPKYPEVDYGEGEQAELIKKGEYLVKAGDCIACHTNSPENEPAFAGGLGMHTPFGTFYVPNITPDKETGIGDWTKEDFIRAVKHGRDPKGRNYFPVFPYVYFNKLSDDDVAAMWAYLHAVPAVKRENTKNDIPFPFNWRLLQYGWKMLYFYPHTGEYEYDSSKSAQWNRGAYLVEGLGHCSMCHTPMNMFGGPKRRYYLTGGFIDGYWAPNISEYGLSKASVFDVADVFKENKLLNRAGRVAGPMSEVNHNSLGHLTDDDRLAIATYLKSVDSSQPIQVYPSDAPPSLKRGRQVYINACVICHQEGQAGAPLIGSGQQGTWALRVKDGMEDLYRHTIHGYNNMPIKGACVTCSDNDIISAVDYMVQASLTRAQWQELQANEKLAKPVLTRADGKVIYQENCAVCHADGDLGAPKVGDKDIWDVLLQKNMDKLVLNTITGLGSMPAKGGCLYCDTSEIVAAVKYMVQESTDKGDYALW